MKELCYARLLVEIKAAKKDKEEKKKRAFEIAKEANLLQECPICCEDEVLEEDMRFCDSETPHAFCESCVRR